MSDTTVIIIMSVCLLLGAIFTAWQDHKIKNLEKENAVLKNELKHFESTTHPG